MTNIHQLIYAMSDALDLVGIDDVNHGKRVAYMALECANELRLSDYDKIKLFHAALLHDCGVSSPLMHDNLIFNLDWHDAEEHCRRGHQLLNLSPELQHLSNIILYHHTRYDILNKMDIDTEIALLSNLIFMVDHVDSFIAQHLAKETDSSLCSLSKTIHGELEKLSGSFFEPTLVKVFLSASQKEIFWLTLEQKNLHRSLEAYIVSLESKMIDLVSLGHIAKVFANIIHAKSPYTAYHSLDVGRLSHFIATKMNLAPEMCTKIEIGGLLHDLGKLHMPDELLNKEEQLTDKESDIIETHVYATYKILSKIKAMEEITQWALQHHEKLNGKGYPNNCEQKTISLPARIITVADIFQALAQKRPYKTNLAPLKILEVIEAKVIEGEIDSEVVAIVVQHLQKCWEISLLHSYKLNTIE